MDRKTVMIAIAVFIGVLFLGTIGTFYTGYAVLDQSEISFQYYPHPFIKNSVYNDLYIVLPNNYNADEYAAAITIGRSLKSTQPLYPPVVLDKDLPKGVHNLILVGNPCNNKVIAAELNTNKCSLGLRQGQGLLQLVNHERSSTIVVSGYTTKDLANAAAVLSNYKGYPLRGKMIVVTNPSNNLILNYY